jgi:alpha-beta hydrolase superfamily lysophospholipase
VRPALLLAALHSLEPGAAAGSPQRIVLRTEDGLSLAATWYEPATRPGPAVILVHMLHRSRRDWDSVAERLASDGIGALALDLRGHGESGGAAGAGAGQPDYAALVLDLKAARRHLAGRGDVQQARVGMIGASIGANLAALAAAGDASVASLALLSPSLDYRGLRIEAALRKLTRPVLLVASDDDPYALRSARDLQKAGGGPRELFIARGAGHGTIMLGRDPDLVRALVDWFRRTLL